MTAPGKVNGDFYDDKLTAGPRAQRKPRLNRRGFHLSNHPLMKLLPPKSDKEKITVNGCDDSTKITSESSQKKISLSSSKNNSSEAESSSLSTNRDENCSSTDVSSCSSPPKKKHKPITWP